MWPSEAASGNAASGLSPCKFRFIGLPAGRVAADRRAYALAAVVEAGGVWVSAMWINPATVIATSLLVGGTFMGITALGLIAAREGQGDPRHRIAVLTAAFGFGQILGPAFAGYVFDLRASFTLPSMAAAVALVVSAVLVLPRSHSPLPR